MPSRDRNVGVPGQDSPGVSLQPVSGDSPDREPGESPWQYSPVLPACPVLLPVWSVRKATLLPRLSSRSDLCPGDVSYILGLHFPSPPWVHFPEPSLSTLPVSPLRWRAASPVNFISHSAVWPGPGSKPSSEAYLCCTLAVTPSLSLSSSSPNGVYVSSSQKSVLRVRRTGGCGGFEQSIQSPHQFCGPSCVLRGLSVCPSPMGVQSSHLVSARH